MSAPVRRVWSPRTTSSVAGYEVHVYEMTDKIGGMMVWGIPAFRLPVGVIDERHHPPNQNAVPVFRFT